MRPQTFNNGIVAVVSAYAEALGEMTQLNDQLQVALKQASKPTMIARLDSKVNAVRDAAWKVIRTPGAPKAIRIALDELETTLQALEGEAG